LIFIDAGAFLARYVKGDQHHQQAVGYWDRLRATRERLFTSNLVLSETFTLLSRRAGNEFAVERARHVYASSAMTVLRPTQENEVAALELLTKYADQGMSFCDCVSFVLMRRNRLRRVFAFDAHFDLAGFTRVP